MAPLGKPELNTVIRLRASTEDRDRWQAKADAAGMSLSDLIRHAVEGTKPPRRKRVDVDPALLRQLAMLGNNLNQIARWHNAQRGKGIESAVVLSRLIEIDRKLKDLRASMESKPHDD